MREWSALHIVRLIAIFALLGMSTLSAHAKEPSAALLELRERATALYRAGSYQEALDVVRQVVDLTSREFGPDDEQTAIQAYGAGLVADDAADLPLAERYYRQAIAIQEKVYGADSAGTTATIEKLAGVLVRAGRSGEAEPLYQRVLRIRTDIVGPNNSYLASAHAGLGDVELQRNNYARALQSYREALRLLTMNSGTQVVVKALEEAEIKRQRDAFIGLARAAWGASRHGEITPAAALEESYAAGQSAWTTSAASALAKMTARLRATSTDLGRRIATLQLLSDRILLLHEQDMTALTQWSAVQRADPTYSEALDAFRAASIERQRINAPIAKRQKELVDQLQDLLKRCPPGSAQGGCAERHHERDAITKELGALAAESGKGSGDIMRLNQRMQAAEKVLPGYAEFQATRNARIAESSRLERDQAAERAQIVKAFPEFLSLVEPKPLTVAETRSSLFEDEALVSILVGSSSSFVWVVTRERAEWYEIDAGTAMLEASVRTLRQGLDPDLQNPEQEPPAGGAAIIVEGYDLAAAYNLYKRLLAPAEGVLQGKRHLFLVPTGPLTSLPFQVLVTAPPATLTSPQETLRQAPWLIRRHALTVLPSVQSLSALRKLAGNVKAVQPLFGIGDPVLVGPQSPDPRQRSAAQRKIVRSTLYRNGLANVRAVRELVPLPETADELLEIARVLKAPRDAVNLREAATETKIKSSHLDQYRVLHFATHGLIAGDLSGLAEPALVLTPPDVPTDMDDGLLTASEITTLKLDADWVILSACNTAAGNQIGADALSGLARAFFFAGARALLVSHWAVYSEAAVRLTTATFANLASSPHLGRAEAFRRAMLTLIDEGKPPSYWAPFVVVGEGGQVH